MREVADDGRLSIGVGRVIEEDRPDVLDRMGDGFDRTINTLFTRIGEQTQRILPKISKALTTVGERFTAERQTALAVGVVTLNGTVMQMNVRDAEAMAHMPVRQSSSEPSHPPEDPKKPNPFDRAEAALRHAADTVKQGTQKLWEKTKEGVGRAYETSHRSLGKSVVGPLVEIDTADAGTPPVLPSKKIAKAPAISPSGTMPHAVVGRKADGSPKVEIVFPPKDLAEAPVPTFKTPLPESIFRMSPVVSETALPTAKTAETSHIADLEGADYGKMPKLAGEAVLAAWAASIQRSQEDNEFAKNQSDLLDEFLAQMEKWGWNDAAITAAFDMFSDILYPRQTAKNPAADLASAMRAYGAKLAAEQGAPGKKAPPIVPVPKPKRDDPSKPENTVPPVVPVVAAGSGGGDDNNKTRTAKDVEPNGRGRVFLAGFVAGGLAVAALFGLAKCAGGSGTVESQPTPTPSVSATQTPGGGQTPGGEQTPGNPDDTDDGDDGEIPVQPQVQTRLKGAEADKKGDFVRMTSYADRHEARENGEDFSTVWWIAREQLDAVNGAATPTTPEIWKFTDQTLDHNELTWDEARRLHKGQKIRLLSDAAAKQVIETVK